MSNIKNKDGQIKVKNGKYQLRVPHILKNVEEQKEYVRVLHLQAQDGSIVPVDVPASGFEKDTDMSFDVNTKFVNIHTNHFCKFLITAEGIDKCCGRSAEMLVFGSWVNLTGVNPRIDLYVYLGSSLYEMKDYVEVRTNWLQLKY